LQVTLEKVAGDAILAATRRRGALCLPMTEELASISAQPAALSAGGEAAPTQPSKPGQVRRVQVILLMSQAHSAFVVSQPCADHHTAFILAMMARDGMR